MRLEFAAPDDRHGEFRFAFVAVLLSTSAIFSGETVGDAPTFKSRALLNKHALLLYIAFVRLEPTSAAIVAMLVRRISEARKAISRVLKWARAFRVDLWRRPGSAPQYRAAFSAVFISFDRRLSALFSI